MAKDSLLQIRIDDNLLALVKRRAEKDGIDVSTFVRNTLRDAVLAVKDEAPGAGGIETVYAHLQASMEELTRLSKGKGKGK
jgi:metal-responsive CopG/Arc/MetJ family transcriptional regulator